MKYGTTTGGVLFCSLIGLVWFGGCDRPEGAGRLGSEAQAVDCLPGDPNAMVFDRAVCLCGELDKVGAGLTTSGYSSWCIGRGCSDGEGHAHVGINGQAQSRGHLKVDGDLDIQGGADFIAASTIEGDLFVGGDLTTRGSLWVANDAHVGGQMITRGQVHLGGGLVEDYQAVPPCACDPESFIDVAAEVAAHAASATPIDLPHAQGQAEIHLATGDYYAADGAFMRGHLRVYIDGDVRLYVASDVETIGNAVFELADGAQFDLYLAGSLHKLGNLRLVRSDEVEAPRQVRIYIGGQENVELDLTGNSRFVGFIYAPTADVLYRGNVRIDGALFARNLIGKGHFVVRYDWGIMGGGCDDGGESGGGDPPGTPPGVPNDGDQSPPPNDDGSYTDPCSGDDTCH